MLPNINYSIEFSTHVCLRKTIRIMNVQNKNDVMCLLWLLLARIYPIATNTQRVSQYREYEPEFDLDGVTYPVDVNKIDKAPK